MTLVVEDCNAGEPSDLWLCEDQQGLGYTCMVSFSLLYVEILNGNDGTVNFYESEIDADNDVNLINISNYCTTTNLQQIFARAVIDGNIAASSFSILIASIPIVTIEAVTCDTENITYTVIFSFDTNVNQVIPSAGTATIDYTANTITVNGIPVSDILWIEILSDSCNNGVANVLSVAPPNCG